MKLPFAVAAVSLGLLSVSAHAGDPPRSVPHMTSVPMQPANPPSAQASDPFSDQPADYEQLLRKTRTAAVQRTLAQDELEIAQFKQKQAALGASSTASGTPDAAADTALAKKVALLEAQVRKMQAIKRRAPKQSAPSMNQAPGGVPTLQGIFDGPGHRSAWLKLGKQVRQMQAGDHIGAWTLRAVDANLVTIQGPGGNRELVASGDGAGRLRVTSPVGKGGAGGAGGFGSGNFAPGSTPGSRNAISQQTAQSVVEALQHPH